MLHDDMYNNFRERMNALSDTIKSTRQVIMSEEHTKMAYIVPFLANLGFDMSSPVEVVPEYVCDFGVKRGEKVDYALFVNNEPYIIVEAKDCRNELSSKNISQLFRYFSCCPSRLALLSNGIDYWFFTDSEEKNKMDKDPFFKFSFLNYTDTDLEMLFKFHKNNCTNTDALSFVRVQKVEIILKSWFAMQSVQPSMKFVNFLTKNVECSGCTTADVKIALKNVLTIFENDIVGSSVQSDTTVDKQDGKNKGITFYGTLGEVMSKDISGSKLVGVVFEETGREYVCYRWSDLFNQLITEMVKRGKSIEELAYCDDDTDYDVLRLNADGLRSVGEYNGLYYEKNLSAKELLKRMIHVCNCLFLSESQVKICLCSKDDYMGYVDEDMTNLEILKAVRGN